MGRMLIELSPEAAKRREREVGHIKSMVYEEFDMFDTMADEYMDEFLEYMRTQEVFTANSLFRHRSC